MKRWQSFGAMMGWWSRERDATGGDGETHSRNAILCKVSTFTQWSLSRLNPLTPTHRFTKVPQNICSAPDASEQCRVQYNGLTLDIPPTTTTTVQRSPMLFIYTLFSFGSVNSPTRAQRDTAAQNRVRTFIRHPNPSRTFSSFCRYATTVDEWRWRRLGEWMKRMDKGWRGENCNFSEKRRYTRNARAKPIQCHRVYLKFYPIYFGRQQFTRRRRLVCNASRQQCAQVFRMRTENHWENIFLFCH